MNLPQPPDQTIPSSASSASIADQTTIDSFNKKKIKSAQKDHQRKHKLIHQLIQPPLDDEEDSEQEENEESTEEQLAQYELKNHKKMKLNNSEEHNISDTDEDKKFEEEEATEVEEDEESNQIDSSQETPSENEDEQREHNLQKDRHTSILLKNKLEGQEKEKLEKEQGQEEHQEETHSCDSTDELGEDQDDDDEDEDEDYVVTEEDIAQHKDDKILNCQWSEDTLKKLEIDELDEPIDEDCDAEGFDVEEVMNDERKKKYIENLMECLPPYMYCITLEDKKIFFEKLNKEFQRNLEEANTTVVCSHEKKVNFDFASAQVIEFDLNKKVKNISKLPILKGVEEIAAI